MNAIGYIRVSTGRQADDGVSLDAQEAAIRQWCDRQGAELVDLYTDAISAKCQDNRPGLQEALDAASACSGVLVVYSLSRLCRSTRDALDITERLHAAGADLVSLTEAIDTTTAMGRFFFTVMAALAELERRLISERTSAALAHKRANGEKTGGHDPYGYRSVDGKLVEDEAEQRAIEFLVWLREGGSSYSNIAITLNSNHYPTRTGAPWSAKVVRDIYLRESAPCGV